MKYITNLTDIYYLFAIAKHMGRKGKTTTEDPQDEGGATEVPESTKPKVEVEEEKSGAQTEGKYFQY